MIPSALCKNAVFKNNKFARSLQMRSWEEACNIQPMLRAHVKKLVAK